MMTIDDILQDLIEGGLLLDWSTPKGEKFSFRVDGRENVTYTLILSRKKTPFQEKGSKEEQWIIRLESKFTGAKERVKPFPPVVVSDALGALSVGPYSVA
jgi:hypothetical protein